MNKGIIFDFDGVLVDSVDSLYDLYFSVVRKFSSDAVDGDFEELNGKNITEICQFIVDKYAKETDLATVKSIYDIELSNLYRKFKVSDDWVEIFQKLDGKEEMAIASGCDSGLIELMLDEQGIKHYFKVIVGGNMVDKAKPDPQIINLCLHKCDWTTAVLIDDSQNGIKAGLAANCCVLKYDNNLTGNLKLFDIIVKSLYSNLSYLGSSEKFKIMGPSLLPTEYSKEEESAWVSLEEEGAYNDKILCLRNNYDFDTKSIYAYQTEYKRFRLGCDASMLAVSGLVINNEGGVLCAKRSTSNFQNVGVLDLVPSGSLTAIDHRYQLNQEWLEESSLEYDLNWTGQYSFILDHRDNVIDIVDVSRGNEFLETGLISSESSDFIWVDFNNTLPTNISDTAEFIVAIVDV